jgi:thiol-disulfide isomerase/thioredoxin
LRFERKIVQRDVTLRAAGDDRDASPHEFFRPHTLIEPWSPPQAEPEMRIAAIATQRMLLGASFLLATAVVALTGCDAQRKTVPPVSPPGQTGKVVEQSTVELQTVTKEQFEQVIASHKGKVVLVDFWATWCGPCVKQFPHTVEIWHKYREKGLDVISVSVDELKDDQNVREFLASKGAGFQNLLTTYGLDAITEFDVDNGGVPCYWIYDRTGKLVDRISPGDPTKKFTPQLIDDAVERALAAGAGTATVTDAAAAADATIATDAAPSAADATGPNAAAKASDEATPNP